MTKLLVLLGAALMAFLVVACRPSSAHTTHVEGAEARQLVEGGATLLDVRTPEEFEARHLPGAVNIPVQDLDGRLGELGTKDKPVVVYCQSGSRSARAVATLNGAGFQTVRDLGPMSAW